MANPADDSLRNLLGMNSDTASMGANGLTVGILALQWLQNQGKDNTLNRIFGIKTTGHILKEETANVLGATSEYNKDLAKISTGVTEGIKAQEATQKAQIADSAKARGFTAQVANASQQQYGGSLSGAYATAAKALAMAKGQATSQMGRVMSGYYQNLAGVQFQDLLENRAERAGIIGQIAGMSSSIMKNAMSSTGPTQAEKDAATPASIRNSESLAIQAKAISDAERMADTFSAQGLNPIQIPQRRA